MGRRQNGEGSVYQRTDGRWVASIQAGGYRRSVYGKSKQEARTKLKTLRQQALGGTLALPSRQTLAQLVEAWLNNDPSMKLTTKISNRKFLSHYIYPTLGSMRIDQITPERIQSAYMMLSPSVARRAHAALHRAFVVAERWRWLSDNPCKRVTLPKYEQRAHTIWSAGDIQKFLVGVRGFWLEPLYVLLLTTGIRIGEALALAWAEAGDGVLHIGGTLRWIDGQPVINTPKTRAGRRTIILSTLALSALDQQRALQATWREKAGDRWVSTPQIFTRRNGRLLNESSPLTALQRCCRQLGIPVCTLHELRHLHASLLIDEGVPLPAVSARLGHANPQITLRLYAHALPGQDSQAAQAIERMLSRNLPPDNPAEASAEAGFVLPRAAEEYP